MPSRNVNIIILAACVSFLCYFVQRRAKTAMMVGDALEMIDTYYVDPVDQDKLLIAAMNGMTATLDEHSEFIAREDYESFQDSINQEFAGIGIFVEQPESGSPVRVVTPLVGSPALKAGILPGDQIIRVDGQDVATMELHEVGARLKGQVGTVVRLTVQRQQEQHDVSVQRGRIELESVIGDYRDENDRWVFRLREDPAIAYVRLTAFGDKTAGELERVLKDLDNDFSAWSLIYAATGADSFTRPSILATCFSIQVESCRHRRAAERSRIASTLSGTLVDPRKPVAVLIDSNSASASEIVAASLQDHHRASIVGTRSYGKGTVQNILPLQYGRSALRLTVARYYRPNGENIHRSKDAAETEQWGVTPDAGLIVELDEASLRKLAQRWREASYPSLALSPANTPGSEKGTETSALSDQQPAPPNQTVEQADVLQADVIESGLMIDPQLRRAVEHLRDQITPARAVAAAA